MTQEEKQLLLTDLCARLPYNPWVLVEFEGSNQEWKTTLQQEYCVGYISGKITKLYSCEITVKPYLRPMSSVTEEEEEELECKFPHLSLSGDDIYGYLARGEIGDFLEFIYSHHIDLNGLIFMGLALEAPEGMYNIN